MTAYSIHVLEYCHIADVSRAMVMYDAHDTGTIRLPFSYILIRSSDTVALVDTGHNNEGTGAGLAAEFLIENWASPRAILEPFGLKPEDVEHVFLTHAHFDHMGGLALFPNATFYLQQRELSNWIWAMSLDSRFRWLLGAIDTSDILRAVDLARKKRLVCLDGQKSDVLPGIDLVPAFDTHTAGSQYVVVRQDGKQPSTDAWALAGDLIYQFDNLDGANSEDPYYHPIGFASGSQTNLIFSVHEMVQAVAGDVTRVIPGHEQKLAERFASSTGAQGSKIIELCVANCHQSIVVE